METNNRQKVLMVTVISIVGLLVANSILLKPLLGAWDNRNKRLKEYRDTFKNDTQLVKQKASFERRWERMKTNTLPQNPSIAGSVLLAAVDRWERESRLRPETLSPSWKTEDDANGETITTLECKADLSGNMSALLNFLWAVENDPMGLKVADVTIASKDNNGQQLSLSITLSGLVLDTPQQQPQTPVAQRP